MQIVKFYRDEIAEKDRNGRTFILPAGDDPAQAALDGGFTSYQVLRRSVDYLELTSVEVLGGELFGVAFKADLPVAS